MLTQCGALRFTETEQIAVLSVIVLHYRITILDEPQYAHETAGERNIRLLRRHSTLIIKPSRPCYVYAERRDEFYSLLVDMKGERHLICRYLDGKYWACAIVDSIAE